MAMREKGKGRNMTATHSMSETRARRLHVALGDARSADHAITLADVEGLVFYADFSEFVARNRICLQIDLGCLDDSPTLAEVNARRGHR